MHIKKMMLCNLDMMEHMKMQIHTPLINDFFPFARPHGHELAVNLGTILFSCRMSYNAVKASAASFSSEHVG